jgi:ATP-dependent helicase HrpB
LALLARLGAVDGLVITPLGHQLRRLPLHPRLGRVLLAGGGAVEAAAACALLSEPGTRAVEATGSTSCDLLPHIDRWHTAPFHLRQVADHLRRLVDASGEPLVEHIDDQALGRALFLGYPDRLAHRRAKEPTRLVLASGRGAVMGRESRVSEGEWLVALDVTSGRPGGSAEAIVRLASAVEPNWVMPTSRSVEHRLDDARGVVTAFDVERYDAIVVRERPVTPDPAARAQILASAWLARAPDARHRQLVARARFAEIDPDWPSVALAAAVGARTLADMDLEGALAWDVRKTLAARAPLDLEVPSGRSTRLSYRDDGTVMAAVKLQELFGLADTPRVGPRQEPVTLELLAPNGRPVQTTRDLKSFWARTYPEVRKELRGRYPKHPWPEDPWSAAPTHRTVRRR